MTREHGGHRRAVNSLSWHPNEEKVLLTCSQDATMKLWDLRVQRCVHTTFTGRPGVAVRTVQFHPGGYTKLFIAGLEDGTVQVEAKDGRSGKRATKSWGSPTHRHT